MKTMIIRTLMSENQYSDSPAIAELKAKKMSGCRVQPTVHADVDQLHQEYWYYNDQRPLPGLNVRSPEL